VTGVVALHVALVVVLLHTYYDVIYAIYRLSSWARLSLEELGEGVGGKTTAWSRLPFPHSHHNKTNAMKVATTHAHIRQRHKRSCADMCLHRREERQRDCGAHSPLCTIPQCCAVFFFF
jgi:hypothetical protein